MNQKERKSKSKNKSRPLALKNKYQSAEFSVEEAIIMLQVVRKILPWFPIQEFKRGGYGNKITEKKATANMNKNCRKKRERCVRWWPM